MIAGLTRLAESSLATGLCLGLVWRPILALPQILLAATALVGLAAFAYLRTWKSHPVASTFLLMMRVAALIALVVLLLGPSDVPPSSASSQPTRLAIVFDLSESMLTDDCHGETRWDALRRQWLNPEHVNRLNGSCVVRLFGFAERLWPLSWGELQQADPPVRKGEATNLASSLMTLVSSHRQADDAALLVLSDGHDTVDADLQPVASMARSRGLPIYTVVFGAETQRQDLTLVAVPMQDYLLPGESGAIVVKAYQFGLPQAKTVLHLRNARDHQEIPISFDGRSVVELQLEIQNDDPGQYEYEILLEPLEVETEEKNNRQTVFCQVQDRRIKVLMLEGQPYWDTKFIAQSLRKDERIELTQITQVSRENREALVSRSNDPSPQVPATAQQWSEYDVVIVGNDLQAMLGPRLAKQLNEFVLQQGGHVVFARGRSYDPASDDGLAIGEALAAIEPVVWNDQVWQDVEIRVRPGAAESSWLAAGKMGMDPADAIRQLPGLQAVQGIRRLKPAARVLAEANADRSSAALPAIVTMAAGRGQVAALLGHDSWRWSLRPPTDESLVRFYDTFWSNLVRWLVMGGDFQPGQQVSLTLSRQSMQMAEDVDVEVVFKEPAAARRPWSVVWTDPEGQDRQLSLRRVPGRAPRFRATVVPEVTGVHRFEMRVPDALPDRQQKKLNVFDVNLERLETSARPRKLKELADASGGQILNADTPEELLKIIQRRQLAKQIPPEPQYVWDQAGIMILLLMWIGGEWLLRRFAGLL